MSTLGAEYAVVMDRSKSVATLINNDLVLPFAPNSEISKKIARLVSFRKGVLLTPAALDLLDVSTFIYYADKYCPRAPREGWCRTFKMDVQLRDPQGFRAVAKKLELALTILSGDNYTFQVTEFINAPVPAIRIKPPRARNPNSVALFSGGLDSVAGAVKLLSEGETPLFLRVSTHDKVDVEPLFQGLVRLGHFFWMKTGIVKLTNGSSEEPLTKEPSQRARSFFFLGQATFVAFMNDIEKIFVNENGIMGVHVPLDFSRASTFSTRTVYPPFVQLFNEIVNTWLKRDFKVANLFEVDTKAEVLEWFNKTNTKNLVPLTVSCAHSANIQQLRAQATVYPINLAPSGKHCGYCFPCILRRMSIHSAGLDAVDVEYGVDAFEAVSITSKDKPKYLEEAASAVIGLLRFTSKYLATTNERKPFVFSQISECAPVIEGEGRSKLIRLHDSFVAEVMDYLSSKYPYFVEQVIGNTGHDAAVAQVLAPENFSRLIDQVADDITPGAERRLLKLLRNERWLITRLIIHSEYNVEKVNEVLLGRLRAELSIVPEQRIEKLNSDQVSALEKSTRNSGCQCSFWTDILRRKPRGA